MVRAIDPLSVLDLTVVIRYNVVYRVTQEIFRRVDAPEIDFDDAVKMSNLRNNDYMKNIEQEFLLKLGALQQRVSVINVTSVKM
jgi:hypothetical protein